MKSFFLLAIALTAAAPLPAPRPAAAPERFRPPEVRAEGYRFVVEQVQQQQYEQTEFPSGAPAGAVGKITGRQHIFVRLAVHPPQAGLLPNIEGLDPKVLALAGDRSITLRSYPVEDSGPLGGGLWRCQLSAQEVELSTTRLRRLQGELVVYPKARVVALDFPLAGKLPVTRQADGFRATLRSTRLRAGTLTVSMELEWPTSLSVTRPNPDSPTGVLAVTKVGSVLPPSGSSSTGTDKPGWVSRMHTLTFVDVQDQPEKIRVEALVRSGAAHRVKFTLPDIVLPHTLELEADPSEAEEGGPLEPGDPLYSPKGGTIETPVRSAMAGRLVLGLARLEGGAAGPWRWLDARMEKDRGMLTSVQPGRYRVARAWLPLADPAAEEPASLPVRLGEILEVEVQSGRTVTLPPVEVRGAR